jgi:hypothetical protein
MSTQKNILAIGFYCLSLVILSYLSAAQEKWYGASSSFLSGLIPDSLVPVSEGVLSKSLGVLAGIGICVALAWVVALFGTKLTLGLRFLRSLVRLTLLLAGFTLFWFTFSSATPVTGITLYHLLLFIVGASVTRRLPIQIKDVLRDVFVF